MCSRGLINICHENESILPKFPPLCGVQSTKTCPFLSVCSWDSHPDGNPLGQNPAYLLRNNFSSTFLKTVQEANFLGFPFPLWPFVS